MTKADLIQRVQKQKALANLPKRAIASVIEATFNEIARSMRKDERFAYPGFGTFSLRERKARVGRNPQTGETIQIKKSKTIGFRPAKSLKETL
mgnify:CR=1 FL=1